MMEQWHCINAFLIAFPFAMFNLKSRPINALPYARDDFIVKPKTISYSSHTRLKRGITETTTGTAFKRTFNMPMEILRLVGITITLISFVASHVKLEVPVPYGAATLDTNPLLASGSDWPWYVKQALRSWNNCSSAKIEC